MTEGHQQSSADISDAVKELAAWLIALEDSSMYEPVPDSLVTWGRVYVNSGLTEKHSGDCTKECHSCVVCGVSDHIAKAKQILASLLPFVTGAPAQAAVVPDAWQAQDKKGGIWRHCDHPHSNPDFNYRPLYASRPSPAAPVGSRSMTADERLAMEAATRELDAEAKSILHERSSADTARPAAAVRAAVIEECALICEANPLNAAALAAVKIRSLISEADRHDQDGQTCPTCGRVGNGEG